MGMEQQAPVISETNKIDTNFVPHLHFLGNYAMIRNTLPGQKGGPYEENFCAYVGHCMVLTMVACGKKADNKADSMVTPELYISTVDGKDTVVDKDGKAVTGYTLDKDGNVVDGSGKLVLAAPAAESPPQQGRREQARSGHQTDVKTDAKPADGSDPDSGSSSIGSSNSSSGSSGNSSGGSSDSLLRFRQQWQQHPGSARSYAGTPAQLGAGV